MDKALSQFESNINSVKNLDSVYIAFKDMVTPVIDLSEILRAEIIQIVSALDCYIHDVVRNRMLNIFITNSHSSNAFNNFTISMECFKKIQNANNDVEKLFYLDQEIRKINGYKSFQEPDKISYALSIIGIFRIWEKVGVKMSETSTSLKMKLSLIVDRRNKIAHESDIDPTLGIGIKYPIDYLMVENTLTFIYSLVINIDKVINEELS